MPLNEIGPLLVGLGGLVTAFAAWLKVRYGEGNKRIDAEVKAKELSLRADQQDNEQIMGLVTFQQTMLDKHQSRLDELQVAMELKAEQEAENRAELRLMHYKIAECEQDRTVLRERILRLEESSPHSASDKPFPDTDT